MSALLFLGLLVLFILLMDTRGRMKRAETRIIEIGRRLQTGLLPSAPDTAVHEQAPPTPVAPPAPEIVRPKAPAMAMAAPPQPSVKQPAPQPNPAKAKPILPAAPARSFSSRFEEFFGRQLPIWAGGITLAIAGVLVVNYALAAGLLTPALQVCVGIAFGLALIAAAEIAMRNEQRVQDPRVRQALSGAGIATLYAAILVASNVYGLIGPFAAFSAMAAVTAAALALSMRFGAPSALLGLAGGLATPALISSVDPNIPVLAGYLALTVGGLVAVSRIQRWAWLGISALAGGGLWSLILVANGVFDTLSSLAVGALVLVLAVVMPAFNVAPSRAQVMRSVAAIVGAGQLAMLVSTGGFTPLNWGIYMLIALAMQWLYWRGQALAIVPSISLGLAAILLMIWPNPDLLTFTIVGIAMALTHAVPLLWRLWQQPVQQGVTPELIGLSAAFLIAPMVHFYHFEDGSNMGFCLVALAAAAILAVALALGWRRAQRHDDARFTLIATAAAILIFAAIYFVVPQWALPIGLSAVAAASFLFGQLAREERIEIIVLPFLLEAICLLMTTGDLAANEWQALFGVGNAQIAPQSLLRWGAVLTGLFLVAVRARKPDISYLAQAGAAFLFYGTIAQFVPSAFLPLVSGLGLVAVSAMSRRLAWPRLVPAFGVALLILVGWAIEPLSLWGAHAAMSLVGIPMEVDSRFPGIQMLLSQLVAPALLCAASLWVLSAAPRERPAIERTLATAMSTGIALLLGVGVHSLYRIGFAAAAGTDFIATGLIERLLWAGLLIGAGWLVWVRLAKGPLSNAAATVLVGAGTLHTLFYSLGLHNPLWAKQWVGAWPLLNLLVPLFALAPIGVGLLRQMKPEWLAPLWQGLRIGLMMLITIFAFAMLRQAFVGALLTVPGLSSAEDIMRSITAIALAIGFLLWGIYGKQRDWRLGSLVLMLVAVGKVFLRDASGLEGLMRIGSFIALGVSLIGIGWLYSRQLRLSDDSGETAPPL